MKCVAAIRPADTTAMGALDVVVKPVNAAGAGTTHHPLLAFSVDVEEYYHAETFYRTVPRTQWPELPRRAAPCLERLAGLLERSECRATFFVLGDTLPQLGPLLTEFARRGHELACHGYGHDHLERLTPAMFRTDVRRARDALQQHTGVTPRGYRAPTFSITARTAWALDVLLDEGFSYDASIFPIRHDRYGVPTAPATPFQAIAPSGRELLEFPPLTQAWPAAQHALLRLPLGGGGYLRLLPVGWIMRALRRATRAGEPAVLYVHPWELDPGQPVLPHGRLARWRHRVNLGRTEAKLTRLFAACRFTTCARVLGGLRPETLPRFDLAGTNLRA